MVRMAERQFGGCSVECAGRCVHEKDVALQGSWELG